MSAMLVTLANMRNASYDQYLAVSVYCEDMASRAALPAEPSTYVDGPTGRLYCVVSLNGQRAKVFADDFATFVSTSH